MLCTMLLLAALSCTLSAQAQAVVLMEDFSGETNIFGVSSTSPAAGAAFIYDTQLTGFGPVLAVCNTTVEGTISGADGQPVAVGDGTVTAEWDAFHGYFGNSRQSTVTLMNSDGAEIASYVYSSNSCKVTSVSIGGKAVEDFTAFSLQNANGFGGNGKPYTATGNPHIAVTITARGGVTMVFAKGSSETTVLGSVGTLKKDIAKLRIVSTVENTDRCYAIDNIKVSTGILEQDENYVEPIVSAVIRGAEKMTFGPSTDTPYSNDYMVVLTGGDGTTITESTISNKVTDFKVVWDIEGFKTVSDTEGQYCDSYGAFSVNAEGEVQTTFDLRDVPMNFFGKMTATVTYNGTAIKAEKYVVALGNPSKSATQVLPLAGYPAAISVYPDALTGYQVVQETYGSSSDLIVGGWCVAGSDSHSGVLKADADGTKYIRVTANTAKKSHVITQTLETPSSQMIFRTRLRFNASGASVTLTGGYPFWSSSKYTCPVLLNFDGSSLLLNDTALTSGDAAAQIVTGTWYDIVLSADKSSERCYAMVYSTDGTLLGQSGVLPWAETSNPTYFSIGVNNANTGSVDIATYEAILATIDAETFTLISDKSTLSIPQGENARLSVAIADEHGYAITQQATWSVLEEDMQQYVVITPDANDSHQATVTLAPAAEAGTATIQVNIGGSTKSCVLTLTSSAESIKFTQSSTSMAIPMDAGSATATYAAVLIDGEGTEQGSVVTLSAYEKDGTTPLGVVEGIRFDAATGVLTVSSTASPTQLVIRATGLNSDQKELTKSVLVNIHGTKFDFGYDSEAGTAEGFTVVSPATTYTAANGYGIISGTAVVAGTASATDAAADYLTGALEFDVRVQPGQFYTVEITYQGKLTTGYVNTDLTGYDLGTQATMGTATYTIPATLDVIDLHIADADATSTACIAQVTITKQTPRQKRGKRVVHHIGDSTSANNGSWAYRLKNIIGTEYPELADLCDFHNDGAGGRNLSTYYTQGKLASVLRDIYPDDVVMFGNNGTNGMGKSYEADMNYYLNAAEMLGAKIIINSYTPHGAVSNYASGYNSSTHTFDSYRRDSYETIVRKVAAQRVMDDADYLGFVEIGKNADAAFNAYVADYAVNGYASADAAAQAIITCFTDHNHYSNGTLACDLMLGGYGTVKGIVDQLTDILKGTSTGVAAAGGTQGRLERGTVYTLTGQRRSAPHRPGLFIIGGKKVFVK